MNTIRRQRLQHTTEWAIVNNRGTINTFVFRNFLTASGDLDVAKAAAKDAAIVKLHHWMQVPMLDGTNVRMIER